MNQESVSSNLIGHTNLIFALVCKSVKLAALKAVPEMGCEFESHLGHQIFIPVMAGVYSLCELIETLTVGGSNPSTGTKFIVVQLEAYEMWCIGHTCYSGESGFDLHGFSRV